MGEYLSCLFFAFSLKSNCTDFFEKGIHMNDIIKLLNLEDPDVIISSVNVQDGCKEITLERKPSPKYCPYCKTRMHSKGIRNRSVNHPMMQDGFALRLILKQRRWKCTNPACSHEENENFAFISPGRRSPTNTIF